MAWQVTTRMENGGSLVRLSERSLQRHFRQSTTIFWIEGLSNILLAAIRLVGFRRMRTCEICHVIWAELLAVQPTAFINPIRETPPYPRQTMTTLTRMSFAFYAGLAEHNVMGLTLS